MHRFAVARAQKVGDRGNPLGFGQMDDPPDQPVAQREHEDRSQVDGEELKAVVCGEADGSEKRPGRAVDGEAEPVDERPRAADRERARAAVAIGGNGKQSGQISERRKRDQPARHAILPACGIQAEPTRIV